MVRDMKYFLVVLLIVYTIQAYSDREQWRQFKIKYNRNYVSAKEEIHRFEIFQKNLRLIEDNNAKFSAGEVTYKLGITKFADLSQEEILSSAHGTFSPKRSFKKMDSPVNMTEVPDDIDWRLKGAVTTVKDSGDCLRGSWAFAATAALESRLYILDETLVSLSAQNLLDCDPYSFGCTIGEIDTAFMYLHSHGITTEENYPFTGKEGDCVENDLVFKATAQEWNEGEEFLWGLVGRYGPAAVVIDGVGLFLYQSGILDQECGCVDDYYKYETNSLVVGYGTENDTDFWILKHAWGTDWGENGYFRLKRNVNNTCGIGNQAFFVLEIIK